MSEDELWNLFWGAFALGVTVGFIKLDRHRELLDIAAGRTHMTGTTASAFNRRMVYRLGKHGPLLFTIALDFGLTSFRDWYLPHILDHIDAQLAAF